MASYIGPAALAGGLGYGAYKYFRQPKKKGSRPQSTSRLNRRLTRLEKGYGKELKTLDITSAIAHGTGCTFINLTPVEQGDSSLQREGLQINPRHIQYKLVFDQHASATHTLVRVIFFIDREQQGVAPTAVQLLEADDYLAFPEHNTRPRFNILRDMLITLDSSSTGLKARKGILKFGKNFKIWYSGTTGVAASMGKNAVYCAIVSSEATNQPTVSLYTRLRFVD